MENGLKMVVAGARRDQIYADYITFTLTRPKGSDTKIMTVNVGNAEHYIDCHSAKTTDIEKLAMTWINDFYGQTVKDIRKVI